jgi:hypothetical protein
MRPAFFVIAGIMAVVGLIWVFQGLNVIKGSFMTGQIIWTYIGIVVLVLAGGLAWFTNRKILK